MASKNTNLLRQPAADQPGTCQNWGPNGGDREAFNLSIPASSCCPLNGVDLGLESKICRNEENKQKWDIHGLTF